MKTQVVYIKNQQLIAYQQRIQNVSVVLSLQNLGKLKNILASARIWLAFETSCSQQTKSSGCSKLLTSKFQQRYQHSIVWITP